MTDEFDERIAAALAAEYERSTRTTVPVPTYAAPHRLGRGLRLGVPVILGTNLLIAATVVAAAAGVGAKAVMTGNGNPLDWTHPMPAITAPASPATPRRSPSVAVVTPQPSTASGSQANVGSSPTRRAGYGGGGQGQSPWGGTTDDGHWNRHHGHRGYSPGPSQSPAPSPSSYPTPSGHPYSTQSPRDRTGH